MAPPTGITSPHNPRFRAALALRDARGRRQAALIIIDGTREIVRAIESGVRPVEAWWSPEPFGRAGDRAARALAAARAAGAEAVRADGSLLARLAYGERNEGVVVVARRPAGTLADLRLPDRPLIAVLERVEKPGNVGAVIRSADGAGVDAVLVTDGVDLYNPNVIRASLGTVFTVPVRAADEGEIRRWVRERGIRGFAARVTGAVDYTDADLTGPTAVILGAEAHGLTETWRDEDVTAVRIPMEGAADSLNVSVAAAILFFEARRQRRR